jgi:N-acetyl sugar amidotransferase
MKWCTNCVLPDTRPGLEFDSNGVCSACQETKKKPSIDWPAREKQLHDLVDWAKSQSSGYDCLIPVSGGKDSTWQTAKCLEYGLNPLTVTWCPPGRTSIGQKNLDNLVSLGVDHIDYRINPKVEAQFLLNALEQYGSAGIPMHMAIFNIPLTIAKNFKIPLVIWGENSEAEYGGTNDSIKGYEFNSSWVKQWGVTHGTTAEDWINETFSRKDLTAYFGPSPEELNKAGVKAVFLGHFLRWDPVDIAKIAQTYGFQIDTAGARTGIYEFADIDDDFISIHHWLKWYKFGFTRSFDNLSIEIRNNRISRSEAVKIIAALGDQTPRGDIEKICKFTGITNEYFIAITEKFRNTEIWKRDIDDNWFIPNFIIKDWIWQ